MRGSSLRRGRSLRGIRARKESIVLLTPSPHHPSRPITLAPRLSRHRQAGRLDQLRRRGPRAPSPWREADRPRRHARSRPRPACLPLAVGMATKTLEFLNDATKTYLAEVTFGVETDSHDVEGRVTRAAGTAELTAELIGDRAGRASAGLASRCPPCTPPSRSMGRSCTSWRGAATRSRARRARSPSTDLDLLAWEPPDGDAPRRLLERDLHPRPGAGPGRGDGDRRLSLQSRAFTQRPLPPLPGHHDRRAGAERAALGLALDRGPPRRAGAGLAGARPRRGRVPPLAARDRRSRPTARQRVPSAPMTPPGDWLGTGHADAAGATQGLPQKVAAA